MSENVFYRGDLAQIRSAAEILETLDDRGCLDGMPFMPEMLALCGHTFQVERRAEKACDTVSGGYGSLRFPNTVLLDDVRCPGTGHAGCQAECRIFWKEAWLRKIEPGKAVRDTPSDVQPERALATLIERNTTRTIDNQGDYRFVCQNTELLSASIALSTCDPFPYVRELTTRNVTIRTFVRLMPRVLITHPFRIKVLPRLERVMQMGRKLMTPILRNCGFVFPAFSPSLSYFSPLNLQPGEWVRIKTPQEIRKTLTGGKNRGLSMDVEMMALSGKVFRVKSRVNRIIDERRYGKTYGKMLEFKSDCIILEGAVCSGELSTHRLFCPRAIYPYWRECWLERVDPPST